MVAFHGEVCKPWISASANMFSRGVRNESRSFRESFDEKSQKCNTFVRYSSRCVADFSFCFVVVVGKTRKQKCNGRDTLFPRGRLLCFVAVFPSDVSKKSLYTRMQDENKPSRKTPSEAGLGLFDSRKIYIWVIANKPKV